MTQSIGLHSRKPSPLRHSSITPVYLPIIRPPEYSTARSIEGSHHHCWIFEDKSELSLERGISEPSHYSQVNSRDF